MPRSPKLAVKAIMKHYTALSRREDHRWLRWSRKRKRFSLKAANVFFVQTMLDQGQRTERASEGAEHLVANYFQGKHGFWAEIVRAHPKTVAHICRTGFNGTSYASHFQTNKFPRWLRSAAHRMQQEYGGDPRRIWTVPGEEVDLISQRLSEFPGIGDNLARMAQFLLVRGYGVAGGTKNRSKMSVKLDVLVRRVLARVGITKDEREDSSSILATLEKLNLHSPADFDASLWVVGREFCSKTDPNCGGCPVEAVCAYS